MSDQEITIETQTPTPPRPYCGGGFSEVPPELKEMFAKSGHENTKDAENAFFGVYFRRGEKTPVAPADKYSCWNEDLRDGSEFRFISRRMNKVLQHYIAAEIYNEVVLDRHYLTTGLRLSAAQPFRLCASPICVGDESRSAGAMDFTFLNTSDLKFARTVADDYLGTNTQIKLEEIARKEGSSDWLTDEVIGDMVTAARRSAMRLIRSRYKISIEKWEALDPPLRERI